MKLNHKQKRKIAQKMLTQADRSSYINIGGNLFRKPKSWLFGSTQWIARKAARQLKQQIQYQYGKNKEEAIT